MSNLYRNSSTTAHLMHLLLETSWQSVPEEELREIWFLLVHHVSRTRFNVLE